MTRKIATTVLGLTAAATAVLGLSACGTTANQHVPHAGAPVTTGNQPTATSTLPPAAPQTTVSADCADYQPQGDFTACDVRDATKAAETVFDVAASPNLISDMTTQTPATEVSYLRGLVADNVLDALVADAATHPADGYLARLVVDPAATAGETFVSRGNPVITHAGSGTVSNGMLEIHFDAAVPVTVHTTSGATAVWTYTKHLSLEMSNAGSGWTATNLLAVTASHSKTAGE